MRNIENFFTPEFALNEHATLKTLSNSMNEYINTLTKQKNNEVVVKVEKEHSEYNIGDFVTVMPGAISKPISEINALLEELNNLGTVPIDDFVAINNSNIILKKYLYALYNLKDIIVDIANPAETGPSNIFKENMLLPTMTNESHFANTHIYMNDNGEIKHTYLIIK